MNKKLLLVASVLSIIGGNVFADNTVSSDSSNILINNGKDNIVTNSTNVNIVGSANEINNAFNSSIVGFKSYVDGGGHNLVVGSYSGADGRRSIAIGDNASAYAKSMEDYKNKVDAYNYDTGKYNPATGVGAIAIGGHARADVEMNTAIGYLAESEGNYNTAIGSHSIAKGDPHKVNSKYAGVNNAKGVFSIANMSGENPGYYLANSPVGASSFYYEDSSDGRDGFFNIGQFTRQLQGVAAGEVSATSTDAVNGSQLYTEIKETREMLKIPMDWLENHEGRIQDLENKTFDIGKNVLNQANYYTDTQINKGVAKASALAGLKYLDYNPKDKWSFAASVGHYRNANAVAVGAAYQPNENTMVHGGITVDGKVAYNLGVSVKVGGQKYINKYELAEQVRQLQSDNAELRQELAELRSMIESNK